ncbi:MAG: PHP domain-containing protein [Christensenellaceae bacterium]|nr:PHP domain-containing protein [Christensenellaceae bacterium]MDD6926788.1 PHP domain-containing protein [bacterium]
MDTNEQKRKNLIKALNSSTKEERLASLKELIAFEDANGLQPARRENDSNNHIHTIYSFSPYSPAAAAYMAYSAGLTSCGIMDHDSLSGSKEFAEACKMLGMGYTCGAEVRAKFNRRHWGKINHPDQEDCIYMSAHGVPAQNVDAFNAYLAGFRAKRELRDKKMVELINEKFAKFGISIDFQKDVYERSMAAEGGSITERHLMSALAGKLEDRFGRTEALIEFLEKDLSLSVGAKQKGYLTDSENPNFIYDLLGVLKADTKFFYIDADEEMPDVVDFVNTAVKYGAIPAYAYLGDVGDSVTGDKRAQKFEDDFLDELIEEVKSVGIKAIAYMPTRNTEAQLDRLRELCKKHGFFEISGEDINSPRQKFECKALANPRYANLIDSTWALIGHERASEKGVEFGMFAEKAEKEYPDLNERILAFEKIGRESVK